VTKCLAVVLLCLLFSGSAAFARAGVVYGAGTISCGKWQQYRSSDNKGNVYQTEAWVDGFLSGFNFEDGEPDFLAPKPDAIAFYAWIDNYCREKPLDEVIQATVALKKELVARAKRAP